MFLRYCLAGTRRVQKIRRTHIEDNDEPVLEEIRAIDLSLDHDMSPNLESESELQELTPNDPYALVSLRLSLSLVLTRFSHSLISSPQSAHYTTNIGAEKSASHPLFGGFIDDSDDDEVERAAAGHDSVPAAQSAKISKVNSPLLSYSYTFDVLLCP